QDLTRLDESIAERAPLDAALAIAARHPANPYVAARVSYVAQRARPPDLAAAMRWANRAMYLAPTYDDAHLMAGDLLVLTGHRAQAFVEMRYAWKYAGSARRDRVIRQVIRLSRSPE